MSRSTYYLLGAGFCLLALVAFAIVGDIWRSGVAALMFGLSAALWLVDKE